MQFQFMQPVNAKNRLLSCKRFASRSSRKCYKPGSVSPVLQAGLASLAPRAVAIYLWHPRMPSVPPFDSFGTVPLPNLGFSLAGFTAFHLPCRQGSSVSVALSAYSGLRENPFRAVSRARSPTALVCTRCEHSRHLSLGEPGLSSTANRRTGRSSGYPHFLLFLSSVLFNLPQRSPAGQ